MLQFSTSLTLEFSTTILVGFLLVMSLTLEIQMCQKCQNYTNVDRLEMLFFKRKRFSPLVRQIVFTLQYVHQKCNNRHSNNSIYYLTPICVYYPVTCKTSNNLCWATRADITILAWCNTTSTRCLHSPFRHGVTMIIERKVLQLPPCRKSLTSLHIELEYS